MTSDRMLKYLGRIIKAGYILTPVNGKDSTEQIFGLNRNTLRAACGKSASCPLSDFRFIPNKFRPLVSMPVILGMGS